MKFSVYIPTGTTHEFTGYTDPVAAFDKICELAATADDSGFETMWAPDHFLPFGPGADYVFEVWTTLAALARETSRIRLGQLVTGNGYRNPALLAKMASTVDVISNGRLNFGIGAGWYEEEYHAFGYEFPSAPQRLGQLDEALQIIRSMWTDPATTFEGKHYRVNGIAAQPAGVQTPHIPVMIAGGGEKITLRLVSQYGDLCNVQEPPDEVARKFDVLAKHCATVGRDYSTITKTSTGYCIMADTDEKALAAIPPWAPMVFPGRLAEYGLIGTLDTIRERIAAFELAGVDELIVAFHDSLNPDALRRFAAEFIR
ncbi:LLM class F420-dependent oxidoreductase [Jatrophihabitans sp. DSM 45814]